MNSIAKPIQETEIATTEKKEVSVIEFPYAENVIKEKAELYNSLVISDNKTYEDTKAARTEFVSIRTSIDKALKEGNKPLKERMELNRAEAKRLTELAAPTEEYLQTTVKAWEAKKEEEKQAKIKAERERVENIQARINEISILADVSLTEPVSSLSLIMADLNATEIDESFEEFVDGAKAAKETALNRLSEALAARQKFEDEEAARALELAEIEKQRAELEALKAAEAIRIKAENDAMQAEREAEAERQRIKAEQEAEALQKERDALQAERDAIEAEKRELALKAAQAEADKAEQARIEREAEEAKAEEERLRIKAEQEAEALRQKQEREAEAARIEAEKAKAAMPDFDKLHLALIEFKNSLPMMNTDQGESYKSHLLSVLDSEINDTFERTSKSDKAEAA